MRMCMALVLAGVLGLLAVPLYAADGAAPKGDKGDQGDKVMQQLTPEQRAAVKALLEKFHADMKVLRTDLRTAAEKLKDLRRSGASAEDRAAQREVVRSKFQAIRARWEQFKTDLKAAVPADVYEKIVARFRERIKEFLENHPALKERAAHRKPGASGDGGGAGA